MVRITTPKSSYTIDYPEAVAYADTQAHISWFPGEIEVEKDLHDLKTNFTEAEYHGVISTLKLFTLYEVGVGQEYWSNFVAHTFPRPADIQRMAAQFSQTELCVHAPFYAKLNEVLGLDTEEFYNSYVDDPTLRNRMAWIGKKTKNRELPIDKLKSVAIFSMIEGAILYSSFAFLKHFQAEGKNKLINVTAGINFSVKDENLHSEAGAWLFRTYLAEVLEAIKNEGIHSPADILSWKVGLFQDIFETAEIILEHETIIISKIFEKGDIKGITPHQLINFVKHRLNLCINNLDIYTGDYFSVKDRTIEEWFYKNINSAKMHDFFVKQGNEYNRDWSESRFIWRTDESIRTKGGL